MLRSLSPSPIFRGNGGSLGGVASAVCCHVDTCLWGHGLELLLPGRPSSNTWPPRKPRVRGSAPRPAMWAGANLPALRPKACARLTAGSAGARGLGAGLWGPPHTTPSFAVPAKHQLRPTDVLDTARCKAASRRWSRSHTEYVTLRVSGRCLLKFAAVTDTHICLCVCIYTENVRVSQVG